MAARPSREVTRERERRAWELRQKSWTEQRIADALGIDQATVSRMLRRVEDKLAKEFAAGAERIKAQHTARLEHIADEAYQAWERSQENAETETVVNEVVSLQGTEETLDDEQQPVRVKKCVVPADKATTTRTSKGQAGDPRFLDQARGALADIRDIWGVESPKRTDVTSDGKPIHVVGYEIMAPVQHGFSGTDAGGPDTVQPASGAMESLE